MRRNPITDHEIHAQRDDQEQIYNDMQVNPRMMRMPQKGDKGDPGVAGQPGAAGSSGSDGKSVELQVNATHIQWRQIGGSWANLAAMADLKGQKGDTGNSGSTGSVGPQGPSSKVSLGTLTVTQTALVAITAGVRTITFTGVTGSLAGDDLLLFPASALPAGYAIHNVRCPVNGTVEVTMTGPLLALGASFSIPCRLVALR